MKIAIGCDEAAYAQKEEIRGYLRGQTDVPVEVEDFGVHFYVTPSTSFQFAQEPGRSVWTPGSRRRIA